MLCKETVLKQLKSKNMTIAELSKALEYNRNSVKHLVLTLQKEGLVKVVAQQHIHKTATPSNVWACSEPVTLKPGIQTILGLDSISQKVLFALTAHSKLCASELTEKTGHSKSVVRRAINDLCACKRIRIVEWQVKGGPVKAFYGLSDGSPDAVCVLQSKEPKRPRKEAHTKSEVKSALIIPRRDFAASWF